MRKTYRLEELDCANCAAKMEAAITKLEGVQYASVNFMRQTLTLEAADDVFENVLTCAVKAIGKVEPDCRVVL